MEVLAMKQSSEENSTFYIWSLILTFTFSTGFFMLMPGILGGIADHLGYSNQQIGWVASAEMMGNFCGAILTFFTMVLIEPKKMVLIGALGLIAGNLLSGILQLSPDDLFVFLVLRFATGICSGVVVTTCISLLGKTSNTERNFGLMIASQLCLAMSGLYFLPQLLEKFGISSAFYLLAFLAGLSILALSSFPKRSLLSTAGEEITLLNVLSNRSLLLLFLAIFIFFCAQGGIWTYLDRLGVGSGLSARQVGSYLALGKIFGVAGSIFAALLAMRFGRIKPFVLAILCSVLSMGLLAESGSVTAFLAGVSLFNFGWCFALPYLFGLQASLDKTGRTMSINVTMQTLGIAVGPSVLSIFLQGNDLSPVIVYGVVCFLLCAFITYPVMKRVGVS